VSYLSKVVAISGNNCLLIGGAIDIKQSQVYPFTFEASIGGSLSRKSNMNQARAAFGCHLNKEFGQVYVVGGSVDQK